MEKENLSKQIIGCAMKVHDTFGPGFLESVYQNALAVELRKAGLGVECEKRLQVLYGEIVVGDFIADLVVNGSFMIENKVVLNFTSAHEKQLVNYLTATGTETGLLLNFGAARLEFKRKWRARKVGNPN